MINFLSNNPVDKGPFFTWHTRDKAKREHLKYELDKLNSNSTYYI